MKQFIICLASKTEFPGHMKGQNANAQNPHTKNAPQTPKSQPQNTEVSGISYIGVLSVAFRTNTLKRTT